MNRERVNEKVNEIIDVLEDFSHWESVLVLEMVRSGLDMTNMDRALKDMRTGGEGE